MDIQMKNDSPNCGCITCKLFRNYSLNDLSLQQPGSLAVETDLRRQSSVVTDNESLWLSSCYQDAPDEVLTVNL